ncbi:MAG: helix-turn-helix transcriptional regulator [Chloroflexi bacterium]|nr:helix-turn-helix transcriptional regulator [Chloroflexota bacterium]
MSRAELAKRVGCASATLSSIEHGKRRPSRQIAELLAVALEIPLVERENFVARARGNTSRVVQAKPLPLSNLPASLAP